MNMQDMKATLADAIEQQNLTSVFQPIVSFRQKTIHGFEALSRGPSVSPLHSPEVLFDIAQQTGRLYELEKLCLSLAVNRFQEQSLPGKIFLNASPASLLEKNNQLDEMQRLLGGLAIPPESVVIELTEQYPFDEYDVLRKATHYYRSMGFQIAIDDLGAGYAGLRMWSELRPDYVKIDRHFVQGVDEDQVKQEFIYSIHDIAKSMNCKVIAEGIETITECQTICDIGIEFGQGYYFAHPHAKPKIFLKNNLLPCERKSSLENKKQFRLSDSVNSLLRESPSISTEASLEFVVDKFRNDRSLSTLAVVDESLQPVGITRRSVLLDLFVNPYGRALYGKKPIRFFMEEEPVMVDKNLYVEDASKLITDNSNLAIEDDFIIVDNGYFAGIGKVVDLLKKITDLQIRNARHANPLTMLPGNVPIYELIDRILKEKEAFTIGYFDLDNFKPFNDVYGYQHGDDVIQKLAELLVFHVDENRDFVGHIGGDDFIVIFQSDDWKIRCENILEQFEKDIPVYYSVADRKRGGILASDRRGREQFYDMLSLSIGAVSPDIINCHSHHDVAALATEAKRQAKKITGNSLFIERRCQPSSN